MSRGLSITQCRSWPRTRRPNLNSDTARRHVVVNAYKCKVSNGPNKTAKNLETKTSLKNRRRTLAFRFFRPCGVARVPLKHQRQTHTVFLPRRSTVYVPRRVWRMFFSGLIQMYDNIYGLLTSLCTLKRVPREPPLSPIKLTLSGNHA